MWIVKFRRQSAVFGVINAQSLAHVIKSAGNGKRGGSEHNSIELLKEPFSQNLADVDGRSGHEHAFVAPLVPIHEILFVGLEQKCQFLAQIEAAPADAR